MQIWSLVGRLEEKDKSLVTERIKRTGATPGSAMKAPPPSGGPRIVSQQSESFNITYRCFCLELHAYESDETQTERAFVDALLRLLVMAIVHVTVAPFRAELSSIEHSKRDQTTALELLRLPSHTLDSIMM